MHTWTRGLVSRRRLLTLGALGVPFGTASRHPASAAAADVADMFPKQPPELVREMVGVSHNNIARVRELVEARPSLARAAWDLGFGDWEEAIGAASHVGNREIAEYLIAKGARPSLFSAAMLGQLDVVKAIIAAQPGAQRIRGPHSIPLLAHAKAGGPQALPVVKFLESLGDADWETTAPISEGEMTALTGFYVYGQGETEQIEISTFKDQVRFTRKGGSAVRLFHVGGNAFHPAGADAVRIRFTGTRTTGMTLTIHDPDVVITARAKATSM